MSLKVFLIKIRNLLIRFFYRFVLKPIYFSLDPEYVHDKMLGVGKLLGRYSITRLKTKIFFGFSNKKLEQEILGIKFKNPVGLSAGFDKNAELTDIIPSVGFGFEEIGSITGIYCNGNTGKRLWRLKKSKGLVVYYGLKNNGAEEIYSRLKSKIFKIPIGVNVAMTNCRENLDLDIAVSDYLKSIKVFSDVGSYFTINVSCPNALGGQPFMEPENLDKLLGALHKINISKPIFVKMSPDISFDVLDEILDILKKHNVSGIICTNLTKNKENPLIKDDLPPVGGVSGLPVQSLSDDMISHIYSREGKRFVIIGVGGIFNAEDAYRKIRKGASLVEIITGMIFEGPQVISDINVGLVRFLERDGFNNISEAIGIDSK